MSSRFFTLKPVAMGALWLYVAGVKRRTRPQTLARMTKFEKGASDKNEIAYSTGVSVVYMLFRWSIVEMNTKCTCNVKREEKVRSQPVFKYGTQQALWNHAPLTL